MAGVERRKGMFKYCPSCGRADISFVGPKELRCQACSFTYFHNVAAAVAAILEFDGRIVLLRRGREPRKGKLDLPGGFAEPQENAEEGIRREVMEELKLELKAVKYLGSWPNVYEYEGVVYQTCDLFFHSKIDALPTDCDKEEVAELLLMPPAEIPCDEIAFQSTRMFLPRFIAAWAGQGPL
jgi:ADP-ribose pyrophosphatase YjhB (NUDIX family)